MIGVVKNRVYIKDRVGRVKGWIDEHQNGDKWVFDHAGRVVGRYEAATKVTKTSRGTVFAYGDQCAALIPERT